MNEGTITLSQFQVFVFLLLGCFAGFSAEALYARLLARNAYRRRKRRLAARLAY